MNTEHTEKRYNYFYKITNLINGKFYYGVHSTNDINDGYMGSGKRLKFAIKKYGVNNFSKDILKYFDNIKDAYNYESEIVNEVLLSDKNCYNMCGGGINPCVYNNEYKQQILKKFKTINHQQGEKNSQYNTCWVHNPKTQETIKISKLDLNLYLENGWIRGRNNNPKNNAPLYVYLKDNLTNEIIILKSTDNYDKNKYSELKLLKGQKQSLLHKFNQYQKGEKNSQYNTKIINNGIINKRIKKDELDKYLENGWKLGWAEGTAAALNKVCINNGILKKRVREDELDKYLENGWKLGWILS